MRVSRTPTSNLASPLRAQHHHSRALRHATALLCRGRRRRALAAAAGPQTTPAGQHAGASRRAPAAAAAAAPGGVLTTGADLPSTSLIEALFQPSNDLRELAAAQLHSLFAVLARMSATGGGSGSATSAATSSSCNVKACVYARRADSLDTPNITLQRIACCKTGQPTAPGWPGAAAAAAYGDSSHHFEELDELLTLHRAAWEPGWPGGVAGDPETSLIHEEVVLLPRSNLLVLPLAEGGVLVGLLVVEVAGQQQQQQHASTSSSSSSSDDAADHKQQQTVWEPSPVLGLSEDVLWALRMAVPPLAKACAMELRTALAGAQVEARQALARSLLSEARGPLKVLGTFGSMLSPRLKTGQTGEPEQDMADGMLAQGLRLADVVAQLEAALRPAARPAATGATGAAGALAPPSVSYATQQEQPWRQQQLALPPATRSIDDGDVSDSDDSWAFDSAESQQQQQVAAGAVASGSSSSSSDVTGAAWRQQGQRPQMVPVGSSSSCSSSRSPEPPSHPERGELVPATRTAVSLEASTRDIRWTGIEAPAARALSPSSGGSSSSSSSSRSASTAADASFDVAARTIDLEPVQTSGAAEYGFAVPPAAASTHSSGATAATQQQQQPGQPAKWPASVKQGVVNVVEVLNSLLAAAAQVAAAQGINLIASEPLDPAIGSSSSSSASNRSSLALLPRPVRPLLAGVAVGACRRVLGYCIDVALQCTPRGGQLCVTARASSGGVEVSVMHSGHAQASRLHTSTAALDAAARLGAAASSPPAAAAASRAAAGRAGPRRSSKKQRLTGRASTLSSSSSATSSSSSWSRGMQELSSGAGLRGGSSLITLDLARQILHTLGGRLQLHERHAFMNARSGQLEVGSCIDVWLPPPAAVAATAAPGAP